MQKIAHAILICLLFFAGFNYFPVQMVSATNLTASLSLIPDKQSFLDPEYLILDIVLTAEQQSINAVYIDLAFSPDRVNLSAVNILEPLCSIIPYQSIDNNQGNFRLVCGSPTPVSNQAVKIAKLKFSKLNSGQAKFYFNDNTAILAHNSRGDNLPVQTEIHQIYIIK